jgi:hypothetical protein
MHIRLGRGGHRAEEILPVAGLATKRRRRVGGMAAHGHKGDVFCSVPQVGIVLVGLLAPGR